MLIRFVKVLLCFVGCFDCVDFVLLCYLCVCFLLLVCSVTMFVCFFKG